MANIRQAQAALVSRVRDGEGTASREQRRAAFDGVGLAPPLQAVISKVIRNAADITDDDIASLRVAGLSEDQAFEVVVCAALGQAQRQYEAALAAVDRVCGRE